LEQEAKIARRVRERAADEQCVVCLDDAPEVSTLCCGQVVHMSCLAEWLSNSGSCITCRKPMRRLVQRQNRAQNLIDVDVDRNNSNDAAAEAEAGENASSEDTEEDTTTIDDHDHGDDDEGDPAENAPITDDSISLDDGADTPNNDAIEDTTTDDTDDDNNETEEPTEQNDTTEDTTTIDDDDGVSASNDATEDNTTLEDIVSSDNLLGNIAHDDTTEDTSTGEDTVLDQTNYIQSVYCGQCQRNRFAIDCSNRLCGACCQFYGEISCHRHNCF